MRRIKRRNKDDQLKALTDQLQIQSALIQRMNLFSKMGKSYGSQRDLYESLGYEKYLTIDHFEARWRREDIATTIIEEPCRATWRSAPKIKEVDSGNEETLFEKAWKELVKKYKILSYLRRIDILSGIGSYGVLYIGVNDGNELDKAVVPKEGMEVLYLRPYKESNAEIKSMQDDPTNERYGLPETYHLENTLPNISGTSSMSQKIPVHWSRLLHVAEGLEEDSIYGRPRLEAVWNRLQSLDYILGGSGEMFWRGAFPGYNFKLDPEADDTAQDIDENRKEIENYVHKLSRYMQLQGIDVQSLTPQVSDPKSHFDIQISVISAVTRIPKRKFLGSERGELASSSDDRNWNDYIMDRQSNYVEPWILRPLIDRLIDFGILPEPENGYEVVWKDLNALSEDDQTKIAKTRTETLAKYVDTPGASHVIPEKYFLTSIMDIPIRDLKSIEEEIDKMVQEEIEEIDEDELNMLEGPGR